jgi:hypothetical protein
MRYVKESVEVTVKLTRETLDTGNGTVFFPDEPAMPIPEGYYRLNDVVGILRLHRDQPEVVQYIADMLEG